MILVDASVFVSAWVRELRTIRLRGVGLDARWSETGGVALAWESMLGFLRVVTNPRIYAQPATIARAWEQVTEWLGCGNVWIPQADACHDVILGALLRNLGGGSKLIPDAHLAALAMAHGLMLCSTDGDFTRLESALVLLIGNIGS